MFNNDGCIYPKGQSVNGEGDDGLTFFEASLRSDFSTLIRAFSNVINRASSILSNLE